MLEQRGSLLLAIPAGRTRVAGGKERGARLGADPHACFNPRTRHVAHVRACTPTHTRTHMITNRYTTHPALRQTLETGVGGGGGARAHDGFNPRTRYSMNTRACARTIDQSPNGYPPSLSLPRSLPTVFTYIHTRTHRTPTPHPPTHTYTLTHASTHTHKHTQHERNPVFFHPPALPTRTPPTVLYPPTRILAHCLLRTYTYTHTHTHTHTTSATPLFLPPLPVPPSPRFARPTHSPSSLQTSP